ncbi:MAG: hypothetical protein ABSH20_20085 [Tepidisphaeraceae bacterium]|jgi:hypothetical protein
MSRQQPADPAALLIYNNYDNELPGKAEGWATGIIYFVTTDGRLPCGVPEILNADFEQLMRTSMGTARYRAARMREIILF